MNSSVRECREKRFSNKNSVIGVSKHLYLNDRMADVYFVIEAIEATILVPAHKVMLASCSSVFQKIFFGDRKNSGSLRITNVSVDGFKAFLTIFYMDEIKITNETVAEFLYLSEKFNVERGVKLCEGFLMEYMKVHEVFDTLSLALKFNLDHLQNCCKEEIRCNAIGAFSTPGFLDISLETLMIVMHIDDINCKEVDLFYACIGWAEFKCKRSGIDIANKLNIRNVLDDCFYLIPFLDMNNAEFSTVASSQRTLFTFNEIVDIMAFITRDKTSAITDHRSVTNSCVVKRNLSAFVSKEMQWARKSILLHY